MPHAQLYLAKSPACPIWQQAVAKLELDGKNGKRHGNPTVCNPFF
jgi:hypothetical protein